MNRKYIKLAMASAGGLLVSGAALAGSAASWDAPLNFNQYTVTAGVATDTSTEGASTWTCVTLDATSAGMFMQQVTDPGNGVSYIRTITVEEAETGSPTSGLTFWQEAQTRASGVTNNNIAVAQGVVDGGMDFRVKIFEQSFRSDGDYSIPTSGGGGAEMYMVQTIATAGQTFQQDGVNGNARQRIDQVQGTNPGKFTYASIDGTSFMPTVGGTLGGTVMPALAYASTDGISAVWIGADQPGNYAASLRQFGYQQFRNWGSVAVTAPGSNVAVGTSTYMAQGPLGTFSANGSWDWDAALWDLGAAPSGPPCRRRHRWRRDSPAGCCSAGAP